MKCRSVTEQLLLVFKGLQESYRHVTFTLLCARRKRNQAPQPRPTAFFTCKGFEFVDRFETSDRNDLWAITFPQQCDTIRPVRNCLVSNTTGVQAKGASVITEIAITSHCFHLRVRASNMFLHEANSFNSHVYTIGMTRMSNRARSSNCAHLSFYT